MPVEMTLADLLSATNITKGIPLTVKLTAESVPYQFWIQILITVIGSIFIFVILWNYIRPAISSALIYVQFYKFIKETKKNLLIIKHTASGLFSQSMIDQNTLRDVIQAMQKFKGKPFDVVLYTPGGDVFSSLYISRLLKEYPAKIRAIIPIYSMSGGTLLALSCSEVAMNPQSCLGPVDVQISSLFGGFGSARAWNEVAKYKGRKADDQSLIFSLVGKQYTKSSQEVIEELLMDKIPNATKRKKFVQLLTSGNIEHAKPLTPKILMGYGFPVSIIEPKASVLLTKMLSSNLYEGVYSICAPKE